MNNLIVNNQSNQTFTITEEHLLFLLQQAHQNAQENPFSPEQIIEKIKNYLDIFLISPTNTISSQQLAELFNQVLLEQNLFQTAHQLHNLILNLSPDQLPENYSTPHIWSPANQEKMRQLYLSPNSSQSFSELLEQLATHNCDRTLSQKILALIKEKKFLPHQNILQEKFAFDSQNIVLSDHLDSIFDGVKQLAINIQNNINTTINFSQLRPKLSPLTKSIGVSTGPVSFIKIFASSYDALRQNLPTENHLTQAIILNIHHPDILEYLIFIKNYPKQTSHRNFQFLIEITPSFQEALHQEEDFELINPQTKQVINYLSAKNTFDLIISTIEENPQLGLINLIENTLSPHQNSVHSISGTINLAEYIINNEQFDQNNLQKDLQTIQKYLEIQQINLSTPNQTYLQINITGLSDLLIRLGISFSSIQSLKMLQNIMETIKKGLNSSIRISTNLSSPLLNFFECSKGLETYDQLIINKTSLSGQESFQIIPELLQKLQANNLNSTELYRQIFESNSIQHIQQIPAEVKAIFLTSQELESQFHLNLQQQFENFFQNSFDKKIYLDNNLEQEKLKSIISEALTQNLHQFRYCTFKNILTDEDNFPTSILTSTGEKNFLLSHKLNKKKRSQQIQPPLFQIRKTEEVRLPPINSTKQK